MAGRIKGITVEINGDTTKLSKALQNVDKSLKNTQTQLKDVEKLLKLDPTNTELLAQKQKLLGQAVQDTKTRLDTLKKASEEAAKTKDNYDAWKAKYDPIKQKITETETKLRDLKEQSKTADEQLAKGEISKEKYDALQREIKETSDELSALKQQAKDVSDEFGNPISPEQYDALQREIVETEQELQNLQTEAAGSSEALAKLGQVGKTLEKVGGKIADVGETLTTHVTVPILAAGTAAVKTASDFDSAMSKVAAVSGATGDELDALRDKAREMGAKTKFSASEAAEAMNYMAMAGWKTTDMLEGIEGVMNLAAASGEDLATTSDIVTDALTAFGLKAEDSAHFADVLAAASSNANTNVSMMGETFKYCAPIAG
ncbi:MAG: phage tail tape measure protein, partial [Oscillospiraceae bacterium]|nr:phage tail tape measure protein [Oscillospiraceae bacterium]